MTQQDQEFNHCLKPSDGQDIICYLNDAIQGLDKNNHNSSFENPSKLDKATSLIQEAIEWIEEVEAENKLKAKKWIEEEEKLQEKEISLIGEALECREIEGLD